MGKGAATGQKDSQGIICPFADFVVASPRVLHADDRRADLVPNSFASSSHQTGGLWHELGRERNLVCLDRLASSAVCRGKREGSCGDRRGFAQGKVETFCCPRSNSFCPSDPIRSARRKEEKGCIHGCIAEWCCVLRAMERMRRCVRTGMVCEKRIARQLAVACPRLPACLLLLLLLRRFAMIGHLSPPTS